jgi:hypothetical protein
VYLKKQQLENWGDDKNCEFIPEENWQDELDMPSFHWRGGEVKTKWDKWCVVCMGK